MTRAGRLWPWALGAVLAVTVAGNFWVLAIANADPSFAIEPDYYRKAVDWDSTMAQDARNAALGWALRVAGMPVTAPGETTLTVTVHDASGAPLTGARVQVAATHNARSDQILGATLAEQADGHYAVALPTARPGIWELRFVVVRGSDRFTATVRRDNAGDTPAP